MLTKLRLENFKSWRDTGEIALGPITGFFGANSSGKSSLLQSLLLMKQTAKSADRGIVLYFGDSGSLVDLGDFESTVWSHDTGLPLKLLLGWECATEFDVGEAYGGGKVVSGQELQFEAVVECEDSGLAFLPTLRSSAYSLPDVGQFGLRQTREQGMVGFSPIGEHFPPDAGVSSRLSVHTDKFYKFPYWAGYELRGSGSDPGSYLEPYLQLPISFEMLMDKLHYLGPLRANPNRVYARSGAQPEDMGPVGEFVVDALLSAQERDMFVPTCPDGYRRRQYVRVDMHVADWLKRLGMVHEFRLERLTEGRPYYEVKVRRTPTSPEVLLTDVGFGVSQILPVLTLCFYLPPRSTIIFDQPDIHLHPSVQAGLADVFIDASKHKGVQILFESHSEHLLRRLQRRVAEEAIDRSEVALYFCSANQDGDSTLSHLRVDEFGNISNWPRDFFGDQFGEITAMADAALSRKGRP